MDHGPPPPRNCFLIVTGFFVCGMVTYTWTGSKPRRRCRVGEVGVEGMKGSSHPVKETGVFYSGFPLARLLAGFPVIQVCYAAAGTPPKQTSIHLARAQGRSQGIAHRGLPCSKKGILNIWLGWPIDPYSRCGGPPHSFSGQRAGRRRDLRTSKNPQVQVASGGGARRSNFSILPEAFLRGPSKSSSTSHQEGGPSRLQPPKPHPPSLLVLFL